ncbi:MAG: polysaccharide biosynthesis/export protein [Anaerophaga sp.]|uniref:polysaccharide biosynthesis/export family protein n=1 Tax=Anaerophaga thermohalophila TaxID=177400 RepID=UPI000237CE42|nr:polysaccharide biosynthesis/export family protein [Anaerophaga thermohalophila]MDK2840777.1 polysaccharide biosynthesis/export protein [Anaerophaga sp.]
MWRIIIFSLILALLSGCMTRRRMVYVQDEGKKKDLGVEFLNEQERALVQTFDELYVHVSSFSEENPEMLSGGEGRIGGRTSTDYSLISYQVDENGDIDLPLLGKTHVAGKNVDEVAAQIREELKSYFYSPSVKVSFVNKNVTVIGMVENPGRYFYSGENINIFQALGLAGDIQEYGDREKVVILRESNGRIRKNSVDLTDKRLFISDFYYLKSGDIVYVEPLNRRIWGIDQVPFSLILSAATTSLLIFDYIRRNDL